MVSPGARRILGICALAVLLSAAAGLRVGQAQAPAGEWPGLWGPDRNARVAGPLKVEPGMELREVWRRPLGKGFSEIAVSGGRGYTLFSDGEVDHLTAFEVATGKEIWKARMEATHRGHDGSDDGPISTPVVSDGRIFALDPFGRLFAFEAATGKPLWKSDLPADLGVKAPWYGFATSPLPVGKLLVVQAGGAEKNNLVALDPATGKVVWSSQPAEKNGYSSPVLMTLAGVPQIVASTTDKVFGIKPEDGSVLWSHPSLGEPRQSPVLVPEDRILVMSYNESAILKVTSEAGAWKVEEVWKKPILKTSYSPTVYHGGYLYGMNGTFLMCVDPVTGEVKWREKVYNASLILIDSHLAVLGEKSGNFQIVEATPDGFREKLRARVFTPGARSITGPVFVDGRFLLRNAEEMVMLEIQKAQTGSSEERKGP
jgi:outer membrane protein assembly factor BamB